MSRETPSATARLPLLPGRVERVWLWLAVASLHGLLLLAVRDALLPRQPDAAATSVELPLVVRVIVPVPVPNAAPPDATRPIAQATPPRLAPAEPRVGVIGQAITTAPMVVEAPPAASAPDTRPLNLSVPRAIAVPAQPSMRDQMINDPRSNSPRATIETRVADAAGTLDMDEERMDATRLRVKQRGACVEVHVSRDAQINPWNQSHSPTPKIVKPSC